MSDIDDKERLKIVLAHWVEHNISHAEDFEKWSAKAQALGLNDIQELINQATIKLDLANKLLLEAVEEMGGCDHVHG